MIGTYCINLSKESHKMQEHCGYGSFFEFIFSLVHEGSYGFELSRQKNQYMAKKDYVAFVLKSLYDEDSHRSDTLPASLFERYEALTDEQIEGPEHA